MANLSLLIICATVLIVDCEPRAASQECAADKMHYLNVTNPLVISYDLLRSPLARDEQKRVTAQAFEAIEDDTLKFLTKSGAATPDALDAYVSCLQDSPVYRSAKEAQKVPKAFDLTPFYQGMALAYVVYRGRENAAIPDTLPAVDFFFRDFKGWRYVSYVLYSFEAATLDVRKIESGKKGEVWLLVSGFQIGDTGTRLRLAIIGFDGENARTVWEISGLAHTTLESTSGKDVVLSEYKGYAHGKDQYLVSHWKVGETGLKVTTDAREK